ncbi:GNAT family N-acetyltransferase [Mucilaginibacter sp. X4EP1]|uniref:GNAT family N-acetyltransferase n=1 Tax=Mucilaginibacter sp. X4EP1 TaxID=2723092 RepID=UPI0021699838|nr:GNAT family N-acetyltransferase [Mucilaginibacter sp. X4EP1]MCS3816086.1 GNAT superfamily N-acetyltransferase [Mucilaginibacter sp. X4EP1]
MTDKIIVRKAVPADLPVLLEFEQGIIKAERPFDSTLKDGEIHYYDIAEMIVADNVEVLVAELDNELIGSGYARIENSKVYLKHPKHAYLGFMYVKPEQRGKGINKVILAGLENWSKEKGITELRLDVYDENEPAVKAYEKAGFSKHLDLMRKGIAD